MQNLPSHSVLLAGKGNPQLADKIAKELGTPLAPMTLSRFADGEIRIEINENLRGRNVYILQPTCPPVNENLMELLIMIDACKRASAAEITAVVPYFGYARQDRKSASRSPITAKLVADMLTISGITRLMSIDLHSGQLQGFFDMPVDNLYAEIIFADDIASRFDKDKLTIVSPDVGGVVRARATAKKLGVPLAIIDKRRDKPNQSQVMHVIGEVKDRQCVMIDDMIDTAGTICTAAQALAKAGADSISVYSAHGLFSPPAAQRLAKAPIQEIVVTDTIALPKDMASLESIRILSAAPLIARAIGCIESGDSLSALFEGLQSV